jgi:GINS complex subunit 1
MAYCGRGKELLRDLTRAEWLPQYDDDSLRMVLSEMAEHMEEMRSLHREDRPEDAHYAKFLIGCVRRNGKVLHAYHLKRLEKIREMRWASGPVLPSKILETNVLSTRETDFFSRYGEVLSSYCEDIDLDLTADIEPPMEPYIHIHVLEDCGEVLTESGDSVNLQRGMRLFVKKSIVEHFIRQGKVKHVLEK